MTEAEIPTDDVLLQDLIDFSICPFRLWWKTGRADSDILDISSTRTCEQLVEASVKRSIQLYYQAVKLGRKATIFEAFKHVWKQLYLKEWGLEQLYDELFQYSVQRENLIKKFSANKSLIKDMPVVWEKDWLEQARLSGLIDLLNNIGRNHDKIGLPGMGNPEGNPFRGPIGLAEAFSISSQMINNLSQDLLEPDIVLGVFSPVIVELPSCKLKGRADIVILNTDLSEKRKTKAHIVYELHDYEDLPLSEKNCYSDVRVLTFLESLPENINIPDKEIVLDSIIYRHLRSGKKFNIKLGNKTGKDILEGLATSLIVCKRNGAYIPRMIYGGWASCGNCDYRPLCSTTPDVFRIYNPPMLERGNLSYDMYLKFQELSKSSPQSFEVLRNIMIWIYETKSINSENVLWALNQIKKGLGSKHD